RHDPPALLRFLAGRRVARLFCPVVVLHQLADAAAATGVLPVTLREVITAGEALQVTPAVRDFFARLPGCSLHNHYGPSETHGVIEFLGRADDQVKVRGFRVELGEVEAALRSHPALREAAVAAPELAPGERTLVGYVVPHADAPPADELRRFLAGRLPEYMVPG